MWTIIKSDQKNQELLKNDLIKKLGVDCMFYSPKLLVQTFKKQKLINKEVSLLGDYIKTSNIGPIKFYIYENEDKIRLIYSKDYEKNFEGTKNRNVTICTTNFNN